MHQNDVSGLLVTVTVMFLINHRIELPLGPDRHQPQLVRPEVVRRSRSTSKLGAAVFKPEVRRVSHAPLNIEPLTSAADVTHSAVSRHDSGNDLSYLVMVSHSTEIQGTVVWKQPPSDTGDDLHLRLQFVRRWFHAAV